MAAENGWRELRDARLSAGLSQQVLGARCGMSISQISNYERGRRDPLNMSVANLLALSEALGMDPTALIGNRKKGKT